jgi:hypothetical protein
MWRGFFIFEGFITKIGDGLEDIEVSPMPS